MIRGRPKYMVYYDVAHFGHARKKPRAKHRTCGRFLTISYLEWRCGVVRCLCSGDQMRAGDYGKID